MFSCYSTLSTRYIVIYLRSPLLLTEHITPLPDVASCSDGQLRLTDSYSYYKHVDICSNQRWGALSSSQWYYYNTMVACTELGYRGMHVRQ